MAVLVSRQPRYGEETMRRVPIALLAVVFVLAIASAAPATERTPAGSFLKFRATNVNQLANEIAKDTTARVRYAQHFGVSPDEVGKYFTKNLKLTTLKSPMKVQTWYVGKQGHVYKKTKLYPKGTLVFASSDGKPLLAWSCGNPLSASLPLKLKEEPVVASSGNVETKVLANPVETVTAAAVTSPPIVEVVAVAPVAAPMPMDALAMPPVAVPPPVVSRFPWFLLFGFAPKPHDHPKVPEPGTLVAMAMGLSSGAFLIRRSRVRR